MTHPSSSTVVATALCATLLAGCVSTEGTGSGGGSSKEGPRESLAPIDTTKAAIQAGTTNKKQAVSTPTKRGSRSTKFTARQDTLKASFVRKNRLPFRALRIERPQNPAFTVQIGAFARPNNALRNQKVAKSRFPHYTVYNSFDKRSNIYRVSIGKFITRREAAAVRKKVLNLFPKEYSGCWVNYIPK